MAEKKMDTLWNMSGEHNVSKQIYDVFKPEETQTQTFYADFEKLNKGKLELSVSKFTQDMLSEFVKRISECDTIKMTLEVEK